MRLTDISQLTHELDGVSESRTDSMIAWRYRGRLVARQLDDDTHIVIRSAFDARDLLVRTFPETFSIPTRFVKHMMVVADLQHGDAAAIEDAIKAAWKLQSEQ